MKHLGDITKISGYAVPVVDIVTGGSPCQDLSVAAGKRAGLAGERSGLFMEQIRIIKEMRKHYVETNGLVGILRTEKAGIKPRYMVWENVSGAFSSNNGEDFRAVLEETARVAEEGISIPRLKEGQKWSNAGTICGNGWSIAWRVHDAQYWGVPQRRKRISLLADFNGYSAADILFECFRETSVDGVYETVTNTGNESREEIQSISEVVPRGFESSGTERKTVAEDAKRSVRISGENGMSNREDDTVGALCARDYKGVGNQYVSEGKLVVDSISFQKRVEKPSTVRRLTPLECTRLQGFPDGWVDIGDWTDSKGKVHKNADSPKYKALGNSIALPFWKRLAERISAEMKKDGEDESTMASLFDGIGGFPLAFSKAGIKPVWASEIEEFPIAVTKLRFPEDDENDI